MNLWLNFFKYYKTKIYVTSHVYDPGQIIANASIQQLDGISAMFQEPYHEFSSPEGLVHTDIYFCHSPNVAKVQLFNNSKINYCVTIGYIGDHRFKSAKKSSNFLKIN